MSSPQHGQGSEQKRDAWWRAAFIGSVLAVGVLWLSVEYLPTWLFRVLGLLAIIAVLVAGLRTPSGTNRRQGRP